MNPSSCDFDTEGSPTTSTLMSPRIAPLLLLPALQPDTARIGTEGWLEDLVAAQKGRCHGLHRLSPLADLSRVASPVNSCHITQSIIETLQGVLTWPPASAGAMYVSQAK